MGLVGVSHTPSGPMAHRQAWAEHGCSNVTYPFSTSHDNLKVSHPGSGTGFQAHLSPLSARALMNTGCPRKWLLGAHRGVST